MTTLHHMLERYRNGERELPSYMELINIAMKMDDMAHQIADLEATNLNLLNRLVFMQGQELARINALMEQVAPTKAAA